MPQVEFNLEFKVPNEHIDAVKGELHAFLDEFTNLHDGVDSIVPAYGIHWSIKEESLR